MSGRMYPDDPTTKHFRAPRNEGYTRGRHAETEIRYDDDTCQTVDEIVTTQVHLEMMDSDACWMDINGVHVWFRAVKKGLLQVTCFANTAEPFVVTDDMATCELFQERRRKELNDPVADLRKDGVA